MGGKGGGIVWRLGSRTALKRCAFVLNSNFSCFQSPFKSCNKLLWKYPISLYQKIVLLCGYRFCVLSFITYNNFVNYGSRG